MTPDPTPAPPTVADASTHLLLTPELPPAAPFWKRICTNKAYQYTLPGLLLGLVIALLVHQSSQETAKADVTRARGDFTKARLDYILLGMFLGATFGYLAGLNEVSCVFERSKTLPLSQQYGTQVVAS